MKNIFKRLVSPLSENEDEARQEFISNIILAAIIVLSFTAFIINLVKSMFNENVAMSAITLFVFFLSFVFLYFLSRKGHSRLVSYCLLVIFFLPIAYQSYEWGVELPTALLSYVIIIFLAGILISKRFAFSATAMISTVMAGIGYSQVAAISHPHLYWETEPLTMADVVIFILLFFVMATVSWLSNHEIEKSLIRARNSEGELKKERDLLEIRVEERTKELKEVEAEKMTQLYRFAEFGRLSSGLFHDLVNPLNAVALNMEKVKTQEKDGATLDETKACLEKALLATKKMEDLVVAVRKQLAKQESKELFSLTEEIKQVIEVLVYKAQKADVKIIFDPAEDIQITGNAIKFNQIVLNLIANAIDAYLPQEGLKSVGSVKNRKAEISLIKEGDVVIFEVKDHGLGIPQENLKKIFEPFFTTKNGSGMGIGLSMVKRIIEKDFAGTISVESQPGEGSIFKIRMPFQHE